MCRSPASTCRSTFPTRAGRQSGRQVRQEDLEAQPLGEAPLGAAALSPLHSKTPMSPPWTTSKLTAPMMYPR